MSNQAARIFPWAEIGLGHLSWASICSILVLYSLSRFLERSKRALPVTASEQESPWKLQFPPSRRHVLAGLSDKIDVAEPKQGLLHEKAMPMKGAPDLVSSNGWTPTGFSTQEIASLGRFPDYAALSGVRLPKACSVDFDIAKARFRPFRPLRWKYHQTMAHQKLDPDWWVELEQNYVSVLDKRHELLRRYGEAILFAEPGSQSACQELMEMLVQFICSRYPQYFSLSANKRTLHNKILGSSTDLVLTPPLMTIFDNVPEDYAIMQRNESDGCYYLQAAAVCSSVGWDIGSNRGKSLRQIHEHNVPDYAEKLASSMDRFFAKMPTDQPIQRCSWSLEDHAPLFSSPNAVDPEENIAWQRSAFVGREQELIVDDIKMRCDYQTLRRLPLSGAIAFNFKATFTPLLEVRDEIKVPALLSTILSEGKSSLIDYKVLPHVKDVAVKACDEWAREQVNKGLVADDWEVATLDESPFFPGWREKWEMQQGFVAT